MTNKQEIRLRMIMTVLNYLKAMRRIVQTLPQFAALEMTLTKIIAEMNAYSMKQHNARSGIAASNKDKKAKAVTATIDNMRKINLYAHLTNNIQLQKECSYSESRLALSSSTFVRNYARMIHDRCQQYLDQLAEYQITAETQIEFLDTINIFWDSVCASQTDRNLHTQNTQLLVDMFKQADIALNGMDLVAETTRGTNPKFYADYKQARRMVLVGTGSLAVRGTVVNAHTGEPIRGATLTFYEIDGSTNKKGAVVLVKKSAAKGGFKVKNMSKSNYILMVEMNDFVTVEMNLSINDKMQELKIALTAN